MFIVTEPAEFGVIHLIRTGGADFSRWMVTSKLHGGNLPNNCVVKGGAIWSDGVRYSTPDEIDFFDLCGTPYVEPKDRTKEYIFSTRR